MKLLTSFSTQKRSNRLKKTYNMKNILFEYLGDNYFITYNDMVMLGNIFAKSKQQFET